MHVIPWLWYSDSKEDDDKISITNEQDQPIAPESEEPFSDDNLGSIRESYGEFPNGFCLVSSSGSTAKITSRSTASADENGHGLATEEEVDQPGEENLTLSPEERIKRINEIKLLMFNIVTTSLGIGFPLCAIAAGIRSLGECPANVCLPYIVFIMGAVGLCHSLYFIGKYNERNFYSTRQQNITVLWTSIGLGTLVAVETNLLMKMDVSFDSSSENYCKYGFYIFTVVWNLFLLLVYALGSFLFFTDPNELRETGRAARAPHEWVTFESSD